MRVFQTKWLVVLLGVIAYSACALAHEQAGTLGRKNSKAAATDVFTINCYNDDEPNHRPEFDPHHLHIEVFDNRPRNPGLISAQITQPTTGAASDIVTDSVDGDLYPSAPAELASGSGPYQVVINKSKSKKKGIESYTLIFHCESADGNHTGTFDPEPVQKQ